LLTDPIIENFFSLAEIEPTMATRGMPMPRSRRDRRPQLLNGPKKQVLVLGLGLSQLATVKLNGKKL
jgi:hypothetical protein